MIIETIEMIRFYESNFGLSKLRKNIVSRTYFLLLHLLSKILLANINMLGAAYWLYIITTEYQLN